MGSLQGSIRQAKAFVPSLLRSAGYIIHGHSFANPTSATTSRERERESRNDQCEVLESHSNWATMYRYGKLLKLLESHSLVDICVDIAPGTTSKTCDSMIIGIGEPLRLRIPEVSLEDTSMDP